MANKRKSGSRDSGLSKAERQAVKYASKHKKAVAIFIAAVIIIALIAAIIVYFFFPQVWDKALREYLKDTGLYYEDSKDDDAAGTLAKQPQNIEAAALGEITQADFSIHFLELGNKYAGDCTLIKCGDTEVLIDAGSRTNSATTIKTYVDRYCTDGTLEYVIATHAHQDHIAAFVGTGTAPNKTGILYQYKIGTVIQFAGHNTNSGIYNSYVSAVSYAESQGAVAYTALECWNETGKKATQTDPADTRSARRQYDLSVKGDKSLTLNILYNYYYDHETSDENDYSVCVLLSSTCSDGEVKNYLFTGDLEGKGEEYLVDKNNLPQVELFKGGHHGSKTSSTDKLLNVIKPKTVAVCCCAGATEYTDNKNNTFPTQAFIDRISKHTDAVYLTSLCTDYEGGKFGSFNGDIVFMVTDKQIKMWCSNNYLKLKETDWFKQNRTGWAE